MLVFPRTQSAAAPDRRLQRATGASLVLLLHLTLLLAALHAVMQPGAKPRPLRETILILTPVRRPAPQTRPLLRPRLSSPRAITLPPPLVASPPVLPTAPPDIRNLGQSLFGCAPENLANLTPEQRARCGGSGAAPGDGTAMTEPSSHVKNPELRAAEMEKKNTPMNVPCVTIQSRGLAPGYQEHILMVDPVCAAKELNK